MRAGRWRRLSFLVAAIVGLTGCQLGLTAEVDVRADGAGVVRAEAGFDAEALEAVGDLAVELAVDDLRAAGWSVAKPEKDPAGTTWVRAAKPFADPAAANRVLHDLGPIFEELHVEHHRTLLRSRTTLEGTVDLSTGLAALADPALLESLRPDLLASEAVSDLGRQLQVELVADLPGGVRSNAPAVSGGRSRWPVGIGQRVVVSATGVTDRTPLLVAGVAAAVLVAGGILAVLIVRRRRS